MNTQQEILRLGLPFLQMRIHRLFRDNPVVMRYSLALFGHASLSIFHFGLNIFLVRGLEPHDYGLFALAFVAAIMGSTVTSALVGMPLSVYTPGLARKAPRVFLETLLSTINVLLIAGIFLAGLVVTIWLNFPFSSAIAFSGFVASYGARQYSRSFGFARRRPVVTFYGDMTYVALSLTLLLASVAIQLEVTLLFVFSILTVANLVAIALELRLLTDGIRLITHWRSLRRYAGIWCNVRWALIGGITYLIAAQAHSFFVSLLHGASAYAPLAAGFVIFGPVRIGLQTWQNVMRPELVVSITENNPVSMQRTINISMLTMAAGVVFVALLIALFWSPIFQFLYANKYSDAPMGWIVTGWTAVMLCSALSTTPSVVLQAFKEFRILALAALYGAIISVGVVLLILWLLQPEYSLLGILLAEAFLVVFLTTVVTGRIRRTW